MNCCSGAVRAIQALRPGASANEVDAAARVMVVEAGMEKQYLDVAGYGVGIRQSEFYPIIGKGRSERIEAGMVVDLLLPTIYRKHGGGPRITDCVYVGLRRTRFLLVFRGRLFKCHSATATALFWGERSIPLRRRRK